MAKQVEPVRPVERDEIEAARERIAGTVLRTPLVRLDLGPGFPDVRLKLENLQPTNAYKIRGAANAVALLGREEREHGVWTVSAGNAGQGIAYAARAAGIPCTVVAIQTAPAAKIERMRALGARLVLVPYDEAWEALARRSHPGVEGRFIHPFDDHDFIAGHATLGLEILEDEPDTMAVVTAIGGGGLITGVGSAVKALRPQVRVYGVEPETAAPAHLSYRMGSPQVFPNWTASIADGAGGKSLFPRMWDRMRPVVDETFTVSIADTRAAIRIMAEQARIVAEGAAALPLAAVFSGQVRQGPVVCVVSGGNIDLDTFRGCLADQVDVARTRVEA
jgi:threonine dehydratase